MLARAGAAFGEKNDMPATEPRLRPADWGKCFGIGLSRVGEDMFRAEIGVSARAALVSRDRLGSFIFRASAIARLGIWRYGVVVVSGRAVSIATGAADEAFELVRLRKNVGIVLSGLCSEG